MEFNAVNTKILAMGSRLLKFSDYNMLSQLNTVEEVGLKLREQPSYHDALEGFANTELRRTNIEHKLILSLADDYDKLHKFLCDRESRKFLDALFLKTEVYLLKILMCSVHDSHEIEYSATELNSLLGKRLKIDVNRLKNSKTIADFIENLNGTMFYKPLHDIYNENTLLYELEVQLDLQYYIHLWGMLDEGYSKSNTKALHEILGLETDLLNIAWIYRLKAFYKVPDVEIYSHLIPYYYRLTKKNVVQMVESKSIDALLLEIDKTKYAEAYRDVLQPEKVFYAEMVKQITKLRKQNPNSLAMTFSYLFLKSVEISNITSLVEGVRYNLDHKDILKYLTITRGTEVS